MKVKFQYGWFAPSETANKDMRPFSGQFFKKGVHVVPESFRDVLPSSATVVEDGYVEKKADLEKSLSDASVDHANAEQSAEIEEKANDRMAKARAAKAKKDSKRKEEELLDKYVSE